MFALKVSGSTSSPGSAVPMQVTRQAAQVGGVEHTPLARHAAIQSSCVKK